MKHLFLVNNNIIKCILLIVAISISHFIHAQTPPDWNNLSPSKRASMLASLKKVADNGDTQLMNIIADLY